jgi:hypothetical protein
MDMIIRKGVLLAAIAAVFLGGCSDEQDDAGTPPPPPPVTSTNAVILEWNKLLTDNQGAGNLYSFRQYAMLHVAMFEAANTIRGAYRPYRTQPTSGPEASEEAAAAQAGRDIMVALYPAASASFDAALSTRLATLPATAAAQGVETGKQAAQAVLQWRATDGSATPDPAYVLPALPGMWQPTAAGQVAAGTRFTNMLPFALVSPTQYLPTPPPTLNSTDYARDYQYVMDVGRATSTLRTADQTLFARLVAGVNYRPGPFALWNAVARSVAQSRNLSLVETARLFAYLNVAMHDGLQTSQTSKFVYGLWRPVTAIVNGANDGNDTTVGDPTWTPLLTTPPYPSHSSNVACIGTSAARVLARALGSDQIPYGVTWTWTGAAGAGADVTRQYTSFSQLAGDAGMSRVHGGIHFEFEIHSSVVSCTKVADYVFNNYMQPR